MLLAVYLAVVATAAVIARWLARPLPIVTLLLFAALPLIFMAPRLPADRTPVPTDHLSAYCVPWKSATARSPYNATLSDFASQFAPWAKAVRVAWKEGSFPWRDRWTGCGSALAANGQSSAFSPFTFLMFLLPLFRAFTLEGALKLFLAMTGMGLWLAELGVSRHAVRLGGILFGLSFALTPWLYHPATAGLCLWPWILFALECQRARSDKRSWWLLVVLVSTWPLCGHLETVAVGSLFVLSWVVLRIAARDATEPRGWLIRLATAGLLGLGLSSFLLVPQTYAILASNRFVLARDPRHLMYVPWVPYRPGWLGALATSVFPRAYGDSVATPMYPGAAGSIVEMGFGYIGLVGWGCALAVPVRRSTARERVLAFLGVFGLGAAMGIPPFKQAVDLVPGIRLAPPLRLLLFTSISGSALASLALDRFFRSEAEALRMSRALVLRLAGLAGFGIVLFVAKRRVYESAGTLHIEQGILGWNLVVALLAAAVCATFALRKIRSPRAVAVPLLAIAAAQLLYEGMRLYRFYPTSSFYPQTPLLAFLGAQPRPFRVVGEKTALFPNTNVFPGLENIGTHDPMERRDYVEFLDRTCGYPPTDYAKQIRNLNAPALDFLNVRYLVSDAARASPGPKWSPAYSGPDGTVFSNTVVMPRFFAPAHVEIIPPADTGAGSRRNAFSAFGAPLEAFLATGHFSDRALLLAGELGTLNPGVRDQGVNGVKISAIDERTNLIELTTVVHRGPAIIVGSIVQDGGWTVEDETGARLPTTRANGPFIAIRVPAGRHRLRMGYLPPGLRVGDALSATAAVVALAVLFRSRLKIRPRPEP